MSIQRRSKQSRYKGLLSMDNRERRSYSRGVYPTQDTYRKGTVRVKHEEEADL